MKQVLFATTALVGFAGAAFADIEGTGPNMINFKGSAEIGVKYFDNGAASGLGDSTVRYHSDLDMDIDMSGSTDSGLSFGASIDLDEVASGIPADSGPVAVFISGDFGTLTIGDTDGAFDAALQEVAAGGTIDDAPEQGAAYGGGADGNRGLDGIYDGQVLRYDYSFSALTFSLSGELDDTGVNDPAIGVGVAASADLGGFELGFGLGYQTAGDDAAGDTVDIFGASLTATVADVTLIVNYTDGATATGAFTFQNGVYIGVSAEYSFGDLTVGANYGNYEFDTGGVTIDGYGAFAEYDLGGGATFTTGFGITDDGTTETTVASAGLSLSF